MMTSLVSLVLICKKLQSNYILYYNTFNNNYLENIIVYMYDKSQEFWHIEFILKVRGDG